MPSFEQELTKWLTVCCRTLKGKREEDLTGEDVLLWANILGSERVTVEEIAFGFGKLLKSETFFPAPAEFLKTLTRVRPSFAVIEDPVLTGEDEIGSRRLAESKGLEYREVSEPPSLPAPSGSNASVVVKVKSLPEPATERDIESKRELMRRQVGK